MVVTPAPATPTPEPATVAPTATPTTVPMPTATAHALHTWRAVSGEKASCTADGYVAYECQECGMQRRDVLAMTGHAFGSAVSQGDGTHAMVCANCQQTISANCEYQTLNQGGKQGKVCVICGDKQIAETVETELPEATKAPAPLPEGISDETVEAVTELVMDVQTAPVAVTEATVEFVETAQSSQESEAPAEKPQLIVLEQEIPAEKKEKVERIFTVGLTLNGEAYQPAQKLKISMPCEAMDEEQAAAYQEAFKLVLLMEDGSMVEIPYEIKDGKLTFETTKMGVFALVPVEELETK